MLNTAEFVEFLIDKTTERISGRLRISILSRFKTQQYSQRGLIKSMIDPPFLIDSLSLRRQEEIPAITYNSGGTYTLGALMQAVEVLQVHTLSMGINGTQLNDL